MAGSTRHGKAIISEDQVRYIGKLISRSIDVPADDADQVTDEPRAFEE